MFTCCFLACSYSSPPLIICCSAFLESALNIFYIFEVCLRDLICFTSVVFQCSIILPNVGNIYNFQHIFQGMTSFVRWRMHFYPLLSVLPSPLLSLSLSLRGHNRARRQVFLTQLFSQASSLQLHSHTLIHDLIAVQYLKFLCVCVFMCVCVWHVYAVYWHFVKFDMTIHLSNVSGFIQSSHSTNSCAFISQIEITLLST